MRYEYEVAPVPCEISGIADLVADEPLAWQSCSSHHAQHFKSQEKETFLTSGKASAVLKELIA